MTLLQMKAVVLAAELGSISLAAKQMNISQSNVSAYISDVEKELGGKLLHRSRNGIVPTEEMGTDFIKHAKIILKEQETISNLGSKKKIYRLRVGCMNWGVAAKAFTAMCIKHLGTNDVDLRYMNTSIEKGIEMLVEHKIDVLVAFVRNNLIAQTELVLSANNLEKIQIGTMQATIRLRTNHPLTQTAIDSDGYINTAQLKAYPYVDYWSFRHETEYISFYNNFDTGSNVVIIDDTDSRFEIVAKTDAYSMGVELSPEIKEKYGLVCYPIKDLWAAAYIITRPSDKYNQDLNEYIDMLINKANKYLK